MCEDLGSCFKEEFVALRRLAFNLFDMDCDDALCDYDVIEFDSYFIQKNAYLPQCSADIEVLVRTLNSIAKLKGQKEADKLEDIFRAAGMQKVNGKFEVVRGQKTTINSNGRSSSLSLVSS